MVPYFLRMVPMWHDDVIELKHFSCYWPFVRGIHRSPVDFPHKEQVTQSFDVFWVFFLVYAWTNGWTNSGISSDLIRYAGHMTSMKWTWLWCRSDAGLAPSLWETSFQSNAVSHGLGAHLESALWPVSPVQQPLSSCACRWADAD